jgi:hypothetical protein
MAVRTFSWPQAKTVVATYREFLVATVNSVVLVECGRDEVAGQARCRHVPDPYPPDEAVLHY